MEHAARKQEAEARNGKFEQKGWHTTSHSSTGGVGDGRELAAGGAGNTLGKQMEPHDERVTPGINMQRTSCQ